MLALISKNFRHRKDPQHILHHTCKNLQAEHLSEASISKFLRHSKDPRHIRSHSCKVLQAQSHSHYLSKGCFCRLKNYSTLHPISTVYPNVFLVLHIPYYQDQHHHTLILQNTLHYHSICRRVYQACCLFSTW